MVKCSMHCCNYYYQTGLKTTLFTLPKVKPLNDRKTDKEREGKLKAMISNGQRAAWLSVTKKGMLTTIVVLKMKGNKPLKHACSVFILAV